MRTFCIGLAVLFFGFGAWQVQAEEPCIPIFLGVEEIPEPVGEVRLSELLPNPSTGEEYIELQIITGGAFDAWSLRDASGKTVSLAEAVEESGYLLFWRTDSKLSLNNSGDTIELINPSGKVVEKTTYESIGDDIAWSLVDGIWMETEPTPGEQNIPLEETLEEEEEATEQDPIAGLQNIASIKTLEKGEQVIIEGVVSAPFGLIGSRSAYIQDETGGIQLYISKGDLPDLEEGDVVQVSGKTSTYLDEPRTLTSITDVIVVGSNEITAQSISELTESLVGSLVTTQGEVVEKDSSRITLDNDVTVYRKSTSEISFAGISTGDVITVTGVVSQNRDELRVIPRFPADILFENEDTTSMSLISAANAATLTPGTMEEQTTNHLKATIGYVIGGILAIGYVIYRNKEKILSGFAALKGKFKRQKTLYN